MEKEKKICEHKKKVEAPPKKGDGEPKEGSIAEFITTKPHMGIPKANFVVSTIIIRFLKL